MNARDPYAPDSLLMRNRERFSEFVRSGMAPEEFYRLVIAEGGNRYVAFVALRDHYNLGITECMAVETRVREERSVEATEERRAETTNVGDNPYSPPLTSSSDPSRVATPRRIPLWLSVAQVVANLAVIVVFGLLTLAVLWFLLQVS